MYRFFWIIVAISFLSSCNGKGKDEKAFLVKGTVKNAYSDKIYLEESGLSSGVKQTADSATIDKDGHFTLKAKSVGETVYNLRLGMDQFPFVSLVNDADKINVDADFSKGFDFYSVSGSAASQAIKEYLGKSGEILREKYDFEKQVDSLQKIPGNESMVAELDGKRKNLVQQLKSYSQQSLEQAKSPSLALFILSTYQGMANNPNYRMMAFENEELVGLFNEMVIKFPTRTDIVAIRNSIESQIVKPQWVGKQAPEIALPDTDGKTVSLSSFRGKYVLVDFWASWCGPCRRENPNVVEAYNRFRNKNFTILGVSLDSKKDAWQQAITADKLNWSHVSDLKQWESQVVPMYGIQGIPFNVLVDPAGKVIAENLRGDLLQQKLEQVLN